MGEEEKSSITTELVEAMSYNKITVEKKEEFTEVSEWKNFRDKCYNITLHTKEIVLKQRQKEIICQECVFEQSMRDSTPKWGIDVQKSLF